MSAMAVMARDEIELVLIVGGRARDCQFSSIRCDNDLADGAPRFEELVGGSLWALQVPPPQNHVSTYGGHRRFQDSVLGKGTYELRAPVPETLTPFYGASFAIVPRQGLCI
jgi:hypothetical protein